MTDILHFPRLKTDRRNGKTVRVDLVRRYGFALLAFAGALAIRLLLHPLVEDRPLFALFLSSVVIAGIFAGLGPAILVTGLSLLYDAVIKIMTAHLEPADHINTVTFSLLAVLVCWLIGRMERTSGEARSVTRQGVLGSLLAAVPDAGFVADETGAIRLANAKALRLFGYGKRDLGDSRIDDFIAGWNGVGGAGAEPVAGKRADGSTFPVEFFVEDVAIDGERLFLCFVRPRGGGAGAEETARPSPEALRSVAIIDAARRERASERERALVRISEISPRERQVLEGLVAGKSNKMIALDLGISPRTVERHRANLTSKMKASSLSDLVRTALLAGISNSLAAEAAE